MLRRSKKPPAVAEENFLEKLLLCADAETGNLLMNDADSDVFVYYEIGKPTVTLDGDFTAENLRLLADHMTGASRRG